MKWYEAIFAFLPLTLIVAWLAGKLIKTKSNAQSPETNIGSANVLCSVNGIRINRRPACKGVKKIKV